MSRFRWILIVVLFLWPVCAFAQPIISPPIVTESQQALWTRLATEKHPYAAKVCEGGARDNTPTVLYGSGARWSSLCARMTNDQAMARRSWEAYKLLSRANGVDFTRNYAGDANYIREHATELLTTLTRIAPWLTADEITAAKAWHVANADRAIKSIRLNDGDQVVGVCMFLHTMDRAFGTTYRTVPLVVQMRDAIRGFVARADGGGWVDFGDYDTGTLYILFNGAEAAGIEQFPEVVTLREQMTKAFPQWFTPDLKDQFELGDDESPNAMKRHTEEDLMAYLGHYSAEIRGFEAELRQVRNWLYGAPLYPRYFEWADPFGERKAWREHVGTWLVNPGLGKVYFKTGWSPQDCGILAYFPPLSTGLGGIDHVYRWFGHWRAYCNGKWTRDSPIGYSPNMKLGNQTVLAGLSAAQEVGVLTAAQIVGPIVYVSGTNAGLNVDSGYYNPPSTYRYELSPSVFVIPAWDAAVKIERIHVADPKTQMLSATTTSLSRFSAADQARIKAAPLIRSYWHAQTTLPVVQDGVIVGDDRITPLYPATFTVEDMAANIATNPAFYGTLNSKEAKWFVTVDPQDQTPGFRALTTLRGDITGSIETVGDVQKTRLRKLGQKDIVIYSSVKPSPVLTTSKSGASSVYDRNKVNAILAARSVTPGDWADSTADVFIEQANGLVQINPPAPTPLPTPSRRDQLFKEIRERLDEVEKIGQ